MYRMIFMRLSILFFVCMIHGCLQGVLVDTHYYTENSTQCKVSAVVFFKTSCYTIVVVYLKFAISQGLNAWHHVTIRRCSYGLWQSKQQDAAR